MTDVTVKKSEGFVLIADDGPTFRLLDTKTLTVAGFEVLACAGGQDVLASIDNKLGSIHSAGSLNSAP